LNKVNTHILRGVFATVALKPISALIGMSYIYLTISQLSTVNFAIYVTIWACVEIAIVLFNFGSITLATRLINVKGCVPNGPFKLTIAARLFGSFTFALILIPLIIRPDIISKDIDALVILAAAGAFFAESFARTIDSILESWNKPELAQQSQTVRPAVKLAALSGILLVDADITISLILLAECVAIILATIWPFFRACRIKSYHSTVSSEWRELKRVDRVLIKHHYRAQILSIFKGSNFVKIILAFTSPPSVTAAFGMIYAISSIAERYMPTLLFSGIIRPWIIQKVQQHQTLTKLSFIRQVNQINGFFLVVFIGCLPLVKLIDPVENPTFDPYHIGLMVAAAQFTSARSLVAFNLLAQKSGLTLLRSEALSSLASVIVVFLIYYWGIYGAIAGIYIYEIVWISTSAFLSDTKNRLVTSIVWKTSYKFWIAVVLALIVNAMMVPQNESIGAAIARSFGLMAIMALALSSLGEINYKKFVSKISDFHIKQEMSLLFKLFINIKRQ
jgi:hypothetical protein